MRKLKLLGRATMLVFGTVLYMTFFLLAVIGAAVVYLSATHG